MFDHELFDVYDYESIPLNRDCYLMDEKYLQEYEKSFLALLVEGAEYQSVGYISYIALRKIHTNSIELSWYPNVHNRFHEVTISLPKKELIICVGCQDRDEKPHLFVKSDWLENLYLRYYTVFGLIDAIGVKAALQNGEITKEKLIFLREAIDELSVRYPTISFISFADSILIKSNWTAGYFLKKQEDTYNPEIFLDIFKEIKIIYERILGLKIYAVFTQGSNEYYDEALLHISKTKNHISLNSLGTSFGELLAIDDSVRLAIREKKHPRSELYMDEQFFYSLRFEHGFDRHGPNQNRYNAKMKSGDTFYFYFDSEIIFKNLRSN